MRRATVSPEGALRQATDVEAGSGSAGYDSGTYGQKRLAFATAAHDERLASNLAHYGGRLISPWQFLSPTKVARSARVQTTASVGARAAAGASR